MCETWIYGELKKQSESMSTKPNIYHWRTSAGAEVDFVLEIEGKFYPIETKAATSLSKSELMSIDIIRYFILHPTDAVLFCYSRL